MVRVMVGFRVRCCSLGYGCVIAFWLVLGLWYKVWFRGSFMVSVSVIWFLVGLYLRIRLVSHG